MTIKRHIHMYGKKLIYSGKHEVWACGYKTCNHYQPVGTADEFLSGKASICWNCGNLFTLDMVKLQYENPCCSEKCQEDFNIAMEMGRDLTIQNDPLIRASQERVKHVDERMREYKNEQLPDTICPECGKDKTPAAPICGRCALAKMDL